MSCWTFTNKVSHFVPHYIFQTSCISNNSFLNNKCWTMLDSLLFEFCVCHKWELLYNVRTARHWGFSYLIFSSYVMLQSTFLSSRYFSNVTHLFRKFSFREYFFPHLSTQPWHWFWNFLNISAVVPEQPNYTNLRRSSLHHQRLCWQLLPLFRIK